MNFKIHRGTKEIGGSCVEIWTDKTRILLDFGMPLVEKDGSQFDFNKYKALSPVDLVNQGILPDIKGLYDKMEQSIDAVIISHPHQDHFGLINFIHRDILFYLGEATHKIIGLNNIFTSQDIQLKNTSYFQRSTPFQIGDIKITPFWADHSAFDSYSFLVEANGKSIFYSGDFRSHGRKAGAFYWFTHNAPKNVNYLLLEGTSIGRSNKPFKTEPEIKNELYDVFKEKGKINLVYTSGQNIDRITSVFKACKSLEKTLVVDVYIAKVLKDLSKYAGIPYPAESFKNIKVMFPYYTSKRLKNKGLEKILYQFKKYKITKEEISSQAKNIVMIVRNSMKKDLEKISGIDGGNLIYSLWEGYLKNRSTKIFIEYLINRKFKMYKIHTSGHADRNTLIKMAAVVNPEYIVPIHTFESKTYKTIFKQPVVELNDGETKYIK